MKPMTMPQTQHCLLGGHNGTDDELDAQQERHDHGEASHGAGGHQAGDVAACHGEQKHGDHHNDAVPDIQVLVFAVGVGGDGAGQHVGGQSDAYRHVGVHAQKCDEHGTDDRRGAHARKTGAQSCAHTGEEGDGQYSDEFHTVFLQSAPPAEPGACCFYFFSISMNCSPVIVSFS